MVETLVGGSLVVVVTAWTVFSRRRTTGSPPPTLFWLTVAVGVIAVTIGTAVNISGVLLSIPVLALAVVAIWRSAWRVGDVGLLVLFLGLGTGGAYLLVSAFDPDTGSYGDQGALWLVALGILLCAAASTGSLARRALGRRTAGRGTTDPR